MAPWSVTAIADIPSRAASLKIVAALGLERGASRRAAPSSKEYSEWVWRWTNPGPGICAGGRLSWSVFHIAPGAMWTTYTAVIRRGPRLARRGTASRPLVATDPREHVREVIRQRILECDLLTRDRMPEPEPPRVQEGPGEPHPQRLISPAPVGAVAQDRVSDRAEVHPDLVRPAGLRHRLHERRSRHPFANLERRRCGTSIDPVDHDLRRPAAERSLHTEAVVRHLSADQREVAPVDRVMPEPLAESGVGLVGLGHDDQAARSGVQSMNDPGP